MIILIYMIIYIHIHMYIYIYVIFYSPSDFISPNMLPHPPGRCQRILRHGAAGGSAAGSHGSDHRPSLRDPEWDGEDKMAIETIGNHRKAIE